MMCDMIIVCPFDFFHCIPTLVSTVGLVCELTFCKEQFKVVFVVQELFFGTFVLLL